MYHRTFDAMAGMFGWMFNVAGIDSIAAMSFLEIGTGQYLNHPIAALVCGASRVWTYDIRDSRKLDENSIKAPFESIAMANRFLSGLVSNKDFNERMGYVKSRIDKGVYPEHIHFFTKLPSGMHDMVFSYAMFEHVPEAEIDSLLLDIRKRSARYGLHYIDTQDPTRNNELSNEDWEERFELFNWHVKAYHSLAYTLIRTIV